MLEIDFLKKGRHFQNFIARITEKVNNKDNAFFASTNYVFSKIKLLAQVDCNFESVMNMSIF